MQTNIEFKSICKIDSTGRLVVPAVLRKLFNINDGDLLTITATKDGILLTKTE